MNAQTPAEQAIKVLAAHRRRVTGILAECRCEQWSNVTDSDTHAAHVAQALADAGVLAAPAQTGGGDRG